jgi:hypothetical protein
MSLTKEQLDRVVDAIDSQPELTGVIVGYYDGLMCSVADQGYKVALPYWEKAVIVEEIDDSSGTVAVPSDPTDSA